VRDKRLVYKFHEPWQLVADQRFPDEHQKPAPVSGAGSPTEIDLCAKKRRGGDSNSRYLCRQTGFRNRRVQPLRHLSGNVPPTVADGDDSVKRPIDSPRGAKGIAAAVGTR
jgi:hypothetical protein